MNVSPWVPSARSGKQPIRRTLTDADKRKSFANLSRSRFRTGSSTNRLWGVRRWQPYFSRSWTMLRLQQVSGCRAECRINLTVVTNKCKQTKGSTGEWFCWGMGGTAKSENLFHMLQNTIWEWIAGSSARNQMGPRRKWNQHWNSIVIFTEISWLAMMLEWFREEWAACQSLV